GPRWARTLIQSEIPSRKNNKGHSQMETKPQSLTHFLERCPARALKVPFFQKGMGKIDEDKGPSQDNGKFIPVYLIVEFHLLPDLFSDVLDRRKPGKGFLDQIGHGFQGKEILDLGGHFPTHDLPTQQPIDDLFQDGPKDQKAQGK